MRKVLLAGLFLLAPMMAVANPVDDLLNRMDAGAARKFITELQPSDTDFFELSQRGGKVCVKGNTWVNIATGVNWYLKHHAGIRSAAPHGSPTATTSTTARFPIPWPFGIGTAGRKK